MTNFKHALLFKHVVEQGSMASAAKVMNITPSVVSKQIAELEASLGVQLLARTTRNVAVTEDGAHFYQTFCQIGTDWEELLAETKHRKTQPAGVLSLASPSLVLSRVLMPQLDTFRQQFPDISLNLTNTNYDEIPVQGADISIAREVEHLDAAMFVGVPLMTFQNGLFTSPLYLETHGTPNSLAELEQHQCLTYGVGNGKQSIEGKIGSEWTFEQGASVKITSAIRSDSTEVLIQAAIQHQGIVYIPRLIIQKEVHEKALTPVLPDVGISRPFRLFAYYRKQAYLPRKCRVMLDFLKTQYAET
ncbi:LysR family transcriptional regulator [Enterovibrio norvegicus]|uniref:LysR family transcriptional regulator n=1 Tax=Enterovibrio norvegicus TaxID=188144 RepID=UPI000C858FB6|nr:LysR family transcriptional regulator [Enterovibrio norvegicus]PMI26148.1 LysR family transcriptional regulator [Enterovibrio norvegicus]